MRQFGMDALRQIGENPAGRWVIPQEARENQVCRVVYQFVEVHDCFKT